MKQTTKIFGALMALLLSILSCLELPCSEEMIYEVIAQKDGQWQEYVAEKQAEADAVSPAARIVFEFTRFESMEPYRLGYEYIEQDRAGDFLPGNYENICVKTADGARLEGAFYKQENPRGTLIVVCGWENVKEWMIDRLPFLYEEGYQLLFYNRRFWNHYRNPKEYIGGTGSDVQDVKELIDYLKLRNDVNPNKLGIYGFSYGAYITSIAGALFDDLKIVILDGGSAWPTSSFYYWQSIKDDVIDLYQERFYGNGGIYPGNAKDDFETNLNTLYRIAQIAPRPLLLLYGANDTLVPLENGQAIYDSAGEPKELHVFQNSTHCDAMYTADSYAYENSVLNFLAKYF